MGKRKYQAVRVALSMKKSEKERGKRSSISIMPKCPIPKLLTYNNLVRVRAFLVRVCAFLIPRNC